MFIRIVKSFTWEVDRVNKSFTYIHTKDCETLCSTVLRKISNGGSDFYKNLWQEHKTDLSRYTVTTQENSVDIEE